MPAAISDTSPLLYLHRVGALHWIPQIFEDLWIPAAVLAELDEGKRHGYDVPSVRELSYIRCVSPVSMPSEWLSLDLGQGELGALALALENRQRVVLLDDGLARRTASAAGLVVWGTLRLLLEAKALGLTDSIAIYVDRLADSGMWISTRIRERILNLAGEGR